MKILLDQAINEGTTDLEIAQKKVDGRMKKFYIEKCLINQPYCLDDGNDFTIKKLIKNYENELNLKIIIKQMILYNLGESN